MIACVRLPYFAAAIEKRHDATLNDTPLAIGIPAHYPTQIRAVCERAAEAGVEVGMSVQEAQTRCPQLVVVGDSPMRYRHVSHQVMELLATFSSHLEMENGLQQRADARARKQIATFLHLTGNDRIYYLDLGELSAADTTQLAHLIQTAVQKHTDLTPAIGLASGKFTARIAATSLGPGEIGLIAKGQEAEFLADYPTTVLPMDRETLRQLQLLGLRTLGQIAAISVEKFANGFGKQGRVLHRLAKGRDTSPVAPYTSPTIERFIRQLDSPLTNRGALDAILGIMVKVLAERLQTEGFMPRQVELLLGLEDSSSREAEVVLRYPTSDKSHLTTTLKELADSLPIACGITTIEVIFLDMTPIAARQLSLFPQAPVAQAHLKELLQDLVSRYGNDCFYWMTPCDLTSRLPERRFRLERVSVG
jgi:DNA polymerase IV